MQLKLPEIKNIEGKKIRLRKIRGDDAQAIFDYAKQDKVSQYVFWDTHKTISDAQVFINYCQEEYKQRMAMTWGVALKDTDTIIGTVGFTYYFPVTKSVLVGYTLNPDYWGQGYGRESLSLLIDYGFNDCDLIRIAGSCVKDNSASANLMKGCNMQYEGLLRDAFIKDGKISDCELYSITKREYLKQKS